MLLWNVFAENFDRHVFRGDLDTLDTREVVRSVDAAGRAVVAMETAHARNGAEGEYRSAPKSPAAHREVTERTLARLTNEKRELERDRDRVLAEADEMREASIAEIERLQSMIATVEQQREAALKASSAHSGIVDLQARRITTLESVGRIARAGLQSALDRLVEQFGATNAECADVENALAELGATLPEEKSQCVSPADQPATVTDSTLLELRIAGRSEVVTATVREFCDAYNGPDDAWLRQQVRALKPGGYISTGGGNSPVRCVQLKEVA